MARILSPQRFTLLFRPLVKQGTTVRSMSLEQRARELFGAAIEGVQPDAAVRRSLQRDGDQLLVDGQRFSLHHNLHLVGFGKAVLGMAAEAERIVGEHLVRGVVSVPHGIQKVLQQHAKGHMQVRNDGCIQVMEGAKYNLPDANAQRAAERIQQMTSVLSENDLLLVLISGGGSALLPAPIPPITLEEKQEVTRRLAAAGATIQELNTVRRALSLLKGGGLSRLAHPAAVVALILSDIIGDTLDLIASGPTMECKVHPEEVWTVFQRYSLSDSLPNSIVEVLSRAVPAQDLRVDPGRVHNVIIGSNMMALEFAGRRARMLGLRPVVLSPSVSGDVSSVGHLYGLLARFAASSGPAPSPWAPKILQLGPEVGVESWDLCRVMQILEEVGGEGWGATCVLAGGEPTVQLKGHGQGGRNQELALQVGLELSGAEELDGVVFLSGGTDGQDGPTEAAGAVIDGGLADEARAQSMDPEAFLANNDSFTFFSRLSGGTRLLVPGLTGTNVMDVHILLLPAPQCNQ